MSVPLAYISYLVAALVAFGIYVGLPKQGRAPRSGGFILVLAAGAAAMVYLLEALFTALGSDPGQVTFCVLALLGIGSAVRVVTHPKPVYAALYFVAVVITTAAMLILCGAEFLGAALVIVYAGAILVTYVFVIMLSQQSPAMRGRVAAVLDYDRNAREPVWAALCGFMLMAALTGMIAGRNWERFDAAAAEATSVRNTIELGRLLMTDFAVSVELAAVLLMVAMVGAIAIARKRLPRPDEPGDHVVPGHAGRTVEPF
ncbi:MAG: NADH-quinone oxidoreductase subunit J [Phycisphaerae bacterium]|nr:NADH-quinone oxidoreductase subunit J [Phycisphaerae bacterium]